MIVDKFRDMNIEDSKSPFYLFLYVFYTNIYVYVLIYNINILLCIIDCMFSEMNIITSKSRCK